MREKKKTKKEKGKKGGERGKEEGGGRASWQLSGGERERERRKREKEEKRKDLGLLFPPSWAELNSFF